MIEQGLVVAVRLDSADIKIQKSEECKECNLCEGLGGERTLNVDVPRQVTLQIGQEVSVEISSGEMLKGGFMIFILPLLMFLVGAATGKPVLRVLFSDISADAAAVLTGSVLFVVSLAVAALIYRSENKKRKLKPQLKL